MTHRTDQAAPTEDLLVWVDRAHDRSGASNGVSRYQSYLESREHLFQGLNSTEYASIAWQVATGPVMSPGYVEWRPDVHTVTVEHDEESRLVAALELRLRHRTLLPNPLYSTVMQLADWERERVWGSMGEGYGYHEPSASRAAAGALLITARLVVRLHEVGLPDPGETDGVDYRVAMAAIDHLVTQINRVAGPLVDELRGITQ